MAREFSLTVVQVDGREVVVIVDGWHRVTAMKMLYAKHPNLIGKKDYTAVGLRLQDDLPYNVATHIASGVQFYSTLSFISSLTVVQPLRIF